MREQQKQDKKMLRSSNNEKQMEADEVKPMSNKPKVYYCPDGN